MINDYHNSNIIIFILRLQLNFTTLISHQYSVHRIILYQNKYYFMVYVQILQLFFHLFE
jgi:hypothetical protein